ncbi:hypothetical protein [Kribbella sp. NPDC049584]|uniref:hypothetical protein n=1 Tax=Kribbella sp. NPDC049584 TaxID=3154833 RepID=UPI003440D5B3
MKTRKAVRLLAALASAATGLIMLAPAGIIDVQNSAHRLVTSDSLANRIDSGRSVEGTTLPGLVGQCTRDEIPHC